MGLLSKDTFICLDCEATGLDPSNDRIIELAAIRFTFSETLDSIETLIDPEMEIPAASIEIHHISQDMVEGSPKIKEILPHFLDFVGDSVIVGHGIAFDINLIAAEANRFAIPCDLKMSRTLDTLRLARLYGESPSNSLQQLRKHFNIAEEGAHRAMSDVIVNIEVFKHLVQKFKSTQDVFKALSKPIKLKTMPLGKHKGRLLQDIPLQYLLWAAGKDFDQDLLYTIRAEIKRRKKGSSFSQSSNPFSGLTLS